MKNATLLAVKHAALLSIEANELTTTLEVKQLLRHMGYHVDQFEVSALMEEAATELPLAFTTLNDPVPHKIFTIPPVNNVMAALITDTDTGDAVQSDTPVTSALSLRDLACATYPTRFNGEVFLFDSIDDLELNGHTVYRNSYGGGKEYYYAQNISRELARSAHAGVTHISYNDIGSSVV